MSTRRPGFADCVFINCPFDRDYLSILEAVTFTIVDAGFAPRCALDDPDSGEAGYVEFRELSKRPGTRSTIFLASSYLRCFRASTCPSSSAWIWDADAMENASVGANDA